MDITILVTVGFVALGVFVLINRSSRRYAPITQTELLRRLRRLL